VKTAPDNEKSGTILGDGLINNPSCTLNGSPKQAELKVQD
jgi:hypothetical protein